jgi:FKBP-type peptidyl-prolyl cis-trans isomerase SlyD
MQVAKDTVVRFHYSVAETGQPEFETSREREPMAVLVGRGAIVPGVEEALLGRGEGERFQLSLTPAQAYGERRDGLLQRVPKKHLRAAGALKPGMQAMVQTNQGPRMVTVVKVGMSVVDVDLNHPLAGKALDFDIEIVEVRAATDEERSHGHAHGAGGHQHG